MSLQLLSRRSVFGRLFGAAALFVGAGRLIAASPIAEPSDPAPGEDVMHYTYDDFGRLTSVDARCAPCDASPATSSIASWSYDDAVGY